MAIDLHMHTNFSDGNLTPGELVDLSIKKKLSVIAITDHDEVGGLLTAQEQANKTGLKVVNGVELSIDYGLKGKSHLHLVGLFLDPENDELVSTLRMLKNARTERARQIIMKLNRLGFDVSFAELLEVAGTASIGRPHIAKLLLDKKMVNTISQVFQKYLAHGCPAHVPKKKLTIQPAIDLIHGAGGLAILAHPISLGYQTYIPLGEELLRLRDLGLDGIEAFYSSHDRYFTQWLLDFARKENMLISGGSDFHGEVKPDIKPGRGYGNLFIPVEIYENLLAHSSRYQAA